MSNDASTRAARTKFHLGKAWKLKGAREPALRAFREAVELDPRLAEARVGLADLLLELGETREALSHYDRALAIEPDNAGLDFRRRYLRQLLARRNTEAEPDRLDGPLPDNPRGRIRLQPRKKFSCHRGGWDSGVRALESLHNRRGVMLDSFIEDNFAWQHGREGVREPQVLKRLMHEGTFDELATSEEKGVTPYTEPWVGFIHNPHRMPHWFHRAESPQSIFAKRIWRESLPHCRGLFCLSEYQAGWLRKETGRPVSALTHPAEIPEARFSMDRFLANPDRKIVQVGWWLRRLNSIHRLPVAAENPLGYRKVRLVPRFFADADRYLKELMQREREETGESPLADPENNTVALSHLPDAEYDRLLAENIAFVDLHDSGANNTVVECIARATPLLVNPLPAVVEYLGEDYPLYFDDLRQAANKASDLVLLRETHHCLLECATRKRLAPEHFRKSFEESEVYSALPLVE